MRWIAAVRPMDAEVAALEPTAQAKGHALLHRAGCPARTGGGCRCDPRLVLRPDIARDPRDCQRHVRAAMREWRAAQARGRN